jgi:hypothetical protein
MKIRMTLALATFCLALAPAAVCADEQQNKVACMSDALTVCGQFIPDRERVAACLFSNRNRISVACQDALRGYNPRTVSAR